MKKKAYVYITSCLSLIVIVSIALCVFTQGFSPFLKKNVIDKPTGEIQAKDDNGNEIVADIPIDMPEKITIGSTNSEVSFSDENVFPYKVATINSVTYPNFAWEQYAYWDLGVYQGVYGDTIGGVYEEDLEGRVAYTNGYEYVNEFTQKMVFYRVWNTNERTRTITRIAEENHVDGVDYKVLELVVNEKDPTKCDVYLYGYFDVPLVVVSRTGSIRGDYKTCVIDFVKCCDRPYNETCCDYPSESVVIPYSDRLGYTGSPTFCANSGMSASLSADYFGFNANALNLFPKEDVYVNFYSLIRLTQKKELPLTYSAWFSSNFSYGFKMEFYAYPYKTVRYFSSYEFYKRGGNFEIRGVVSIMGTASGMKFDDYFDAELVYFGLTKPENVSGYRKTEYCKKCEGVYALKTDLCRSCGGLYLFWK